MEVEDSGKRTSRADRAVNGEAQVLTACIQFGINTAGNYNPVILKIDLIGVS